MTLAYLNVSGTEIIFIISYFLLIFWAGHYGRHTALGYWGYNYDWAIRQPALSICNSLYPEIHQLPTFKSHR